MDKKVVVKNGQMRGKIWIIYNSQERTYKRAWRLSYEFSALVSGGNLHRVTFPAAHSSQLVLIIFHGGGILII